MTTRNNAHARAGIDAALAEIGNTAGHTHARWTLDPCLDASGNHTIRPHDGSEHGDTSDHPIATVYEDDAANLIAAAPDLLACAMEYERTPPDVRATAAWHTPWYGRLAAAIAKVVQS